MLSTNNRRTSYRDKLFLLFAFVFSATLGFLFFKNLSQTSAVHAAYAGFDAGNIISDGVMSDYNSMSEADIQNFLKSKNPCNDTNLSKADGYWHLNYHVENGHFVCMADERFDGESAAHIIWQAAQDYHINPRVLIVLLQKEQGLVTDTWPNFNLQYRSATGYGCPDTAACDSQYYGFRNQVRNAAELYRYILDYGSAYYPVGNRSIKYNPSGDCGSSVVNIQNRATSALYQYTPYQPNGAVLDAGPGIVVNCGAYGNVNFYYYFTQWFGSTTQGGWELQGITLAEGVYQLKSTDGLALSFEGEGNGAGAQLTWPNTGDDLQKFWVSRSGKYYRFQNIRTGKFLDVSAAVANDGQKVNLWDGNDSCAQKWLVQENDFGYRLISACASEFNTKSLDIAGVATGTIGARVQTWSDNNTNAQRWILANISPAPINEGVYSLKSTDGKALTASNEYPTNGNSMVIWEDSTSSVNQFRLIRRSDGYYRLQNVKTGYSLDVSGGGTGDGTQVQLWSDNDSCAQKWIAEKVENFYNFKNACSGKALDIEAVATGKNNARVQIWSNNTSNAQKWAVVSPTINQPIANGTYSIDSAMGNGQRLDVEGARVNSDGANLQLWSRNGSNNQRFNFIYDANTGYYRIINIASNRSVDVTQIGSIGGNLQVTGSNSGCYQQWILIPLSNGQYSISSACSRNVFDASGPAQIATNVIVWSLHGGINQRWVINSDTEAAKGPLNDGDYYIESGLGSKKVLDIAGAGAFDGANIILWDLTKGANQQFRLITDPATGNYTIHNASTGRNIDSAGATAGNANNVWTWSGNDSCAQKWKITSTGDNYYRIASTCNTNFSLDVEAANPTPGSNVFLWTNHNGANQKWRFTKI